MSEELYGETIGSNSGDESRELKNDSKVVIGGNLVSLSHKSAVVIIPQENCIEQIQNIRRSHDKAYRRWMPHINLLYPFIDDDPAGRQFDDAAKTLSAVTASVKRFKVVFGPKSFRAFKHSSKNATLWLKPEIQLSTVCEGAARDSIPDLFDYADVHDDVIKLQSRLLSDAFPQCTALGEFSDRGFTPHLSLGQFQPAALSEFVAGVVADWRPVEFMVDQIYLISRTGYATPFFVRKAIALCK